MVTPAHPDPRVERWAPLLALYDQGVPIEHIALRFDLRPNEARRRLNLLLSARVEQTTTIEQALAYGRRLAVAKVASGEWVPAPPAPATGEQP